MGTSKEMFEEQRQFEESKNPQYTIEGILHYVRDLTESVENGNSDPIVTLAKINEVEKLIKQSKDIVYESALIEAENYSEKTFIHKGIKVERRSGRNVYDFKSIPEWVGLNESVKNKEKIYKSAYDAYQKGTKMFDEDTGEEIPVPVVKFTKDTLVIKYAD